MEQIAMGELGTVAKFIECVHRSEHREKVKLLKDKKVVEYLLNRNMFNNKIDEDEWGMNMSASVNEKVKKKSKNWSTNFGETVVKEMYILKNHNVYKGGLNGYVRTMKDNGKEKRYKPDWETDKCVIEVKMETHHTSGTAGEKVLGTPVKYCDIPEMTNKPLHIVCIAGLEYKYKCDGIFEENPSERRKKIMEFWKDMNIEYMKLSDIMREWIMEEDAHIYQSEEHLLDV